MLRICVFPEIEMFHQRFAKVATTALGKDCVLAKQLVARLIAGLLLAILAHSHITGSDAPDPAIIVKEDFCCSKSGENTNARCLRLFAEPLTQSAEADDVVALVLHW